MTQTKEFKLAILFVAVVTVIRVYYLFLGQHNLFFDEAQYWSWAQKFSWGYYSKPPMVAWLINLTTSVCGDTEGCVRLSSPLVHAIIAVVVYLTSYELYKDKKTALLSAAAYITLPAVTVSSALISTDPSLLMFWALSMYFFIKATKSGRYKWWVLAGITAGLGMMSKYNMLMFLVGAILYMLLSEKNRKYLLSNGFWNACVIAALIFLPNIIWNLNNGMVSFLHTQDNASGSGISLHPDKMFEFLGAQFGVFGPIFFGSLLVIFYQAVKRKISDEDKFLICFIAPLLLVIITVSFLSRAHANWAAPIYVPATVLVVAWLVRNSKRKLLNTSFGIHIFIALLFMNFHALDKIPGVELVGKKSDIMHGKIKDPFKRLYGWSDLGGGAEILLKAYPETGLLTDSRKVHSELLYYVHPYPFDAVKWNPDGKIQDHFDLTTDINKAGTKDFIFITESSSVDGMGQYFDNVQKVGNIHIQPYDDYSVDYYAYYLKGFKGYSSPLPAADGQ